MCASVFVGCNLYCLDKNYGGVLIIWDRLFGTFQKEEQNEEIIYGLVVNIESFNAFYLQVKFMTMNYCPFEFFMHLIINDKKIS